MKREFWIVLGASIWVGFIAFSGMMAQMAGFWASMFIASLVALIVMFWLFSIVVDADERLEAWKKRQPNE